MVYVDGFNLIYDTQLHDNSTLINTFHSTSQMVFVSNGHILVLLLCCSGRTDTFDSSTTSQRELHTRHILCDFVCVVLLIHNNISSIGGKNITQSDFISNFRWKTAKWHQINIPFYCQHTTNERIYRLLSG